MWFEERLILRPQRAWDTAATAFAVIIFAFGIVFLLTSKAHAQDLITGEGIVCDTQEQVARYILAADAKATLASINEEKANSCAIVNVAYYVGDEGEKVVNTTGVWQITHILVIGTVMHGGVRSVSPTAQWTAFAIETASASLPILLVDNEDGVAENRWANCPYSAWMKKQTINPEARQHLNIPWASCCDHADRVKTQFRVGKGKYGVDEWWFVDPSDNQWKPVPSDIIHEEFDPTMPPQLRTEGVLFVYYGKPTCFWPPGGGG
jgi:hypothetical protein